MLHGLLFTVGLIILSGAISYIGDRVGRRVAKRRLHLFGMRPGKISSMMAVLTGIVIAVGTFLIIIAVSKDVRRMFFEYDQTIAALASAKAEYQTVAQKNEQLKKNNEHLQQQLTQTTQQQMKATGDLAVAEGKLKTSSSKLASVQKQYDENRVKLAATQKEYDAANHSLTKTSGDLDKRKKELDTLDGVRQGLIAEGKRLEAEIERLRTRQLIIGANRPLAYLPVSRATDLADARTEILQVLYQIKERLKSKNLVLADITTGEINGLTDILSKRSEDVVIVFATESNVVAGEKVGISYAVIPSGTVFTKGETIVKADIAANATRDQVEKGLRNMLIQARGIAMDRGLLPDVETGEVGSISAAKFNDTVTALADRKEPVQVALVSTDDVTTLGDLNKIEFTIR